MANIRDSGRSFGASDSSLTRFGNENLVTVEERAFVASAEEKLVVVDLADVPAKANVVRDGKKVPSVVPDVERVRDTLDELVIVPPVSAPRVVSQSIAPGARVSEGTAVDLVLVPRADLDIGVFNDMHLDLGERTVGQFLGEIEGSEELVNLVLKYEDPEEVTETDRNRMVEILGERSDLGVDDTVAGRTFGNAFNSMQVALAFK